MIRVACYGTLRKDFYNNTRFFGPDAEALSTEEIDGFEMYDFRGHYPVVCPGVGQIVIEIFEATEQTFDHIARMELNSGYTLGSVMTRVGWAEIFYKPPDLIPDDFAQVTNGDWAKYLDKTYGKAVS